jgi:beta-glucosidase
VKNGKIKEETIDKAAIRIVRTLLALARAADPQLYDPSLNACEEHIRLAREVAEKSITLLQNNNQVLPFDLSSIKKIVVVGDLAVTENTGDHGSSKTRPPYVVKLLDAIRNACVDKSVEFIHTRDIGKSKPRLNDADAVIIAAGLTFKDEGEHLTDYSRLGGDRTGSLGLHHADIEMIKTAGSLNKNTVVVLYGGSTILLDDWKNDVSAILMAYYPGMEGANAVADILFGKVNPSGKIPFVIPRSASDLPQVDWTANEVTYDYYHGYVKLEKEGKEPRFPYGFGLSYTTFDLTDIKLDSANATEALFSVKVTNTGKRKGGEVVQLYVGWEGSAVDRPVKQLQDFRKVYLDAGEEKTLTLRVSKKNLAYYNENENCFTEEDIAYHAFIGNSSGKKDLTEILFRFE